jgi:two-component sensor histidine kinase
MLAIVQATVHLSHADTAHELKRAIEGRIQALSNVAELFAETRWKGADLHTLVTHELSPFCQQELTPCRIEGPSLILEPNTAQAIAMTLHELATNAAKYGALSASDGRVQIQWSLTDNNHVVLRWTETAGPHVEPPTRQGFGTQLMEAMIRGQLKGMISFDWRPEGLACEIVVRTSN